MKVFKLIVRASPRCIDVLKFLDKNIETINRLGAAVKIEKIDTDDFDEDLAAQLRRSGIGRLPAMLGPDGKVFLGMDQIILVFDKNLTANRIAGREYQTANTEMGNNAELGDFWAREMYAGRDQQGRRIKRKDTDEEEDVGGDINRRLAQYERNVPHHRRQQANETNIDAPPRRRTMRNDNVADVDDTADGGGGGDDDDYYTPPRRANTMAERPAARNIPRQADGDAIDQMMAEAWRNNNPTEPQ
jgi:hypothetical protein